MKNKNKRSFIGFTFTLFMLGLFLYIVGFHNSDICQNIKYINADLKEFNISYVENGLIGKNINVNDCYILGESLQLYGFMVVFIMGMATFIDYIILSKRNR